MLLDPKAQAALALHRFGFGPRPGSIAAIASDPRGALLAELDRRATIADTGLMSSGAANRAAFEFIAERAAKERLKAKRREEAKQLAEANGTQAAEMEKSMAADAPAPSAQPPETPMQQIFFAEAKARFAAAIGAEIGLVERLVWFWSNHFCVNADVTVMAGPYEREAIRPHVLGRFVDLLLAVESHPAMLVYLDNAQSIGPSSVAGINRTRGLNENLAREILELHTLGVRGAYGQEDVTSFAKVLTGWTVRPTDTNPDHGGEFLFHPRMHEPGSHAVLGKSYRDTGVEQGRSVLRDLARHPATARHVAIKLARHFLADDPPASLVDCLSQRFSETEGDLWEVAKALVTAPESWSSEQAKIKRPAEWHIAKLRAAGLNGGDGRRLLQGMTRLGEPLWRPPAPRGFPDDNAVWLDGLAHRLDNANAFAQRIAGQVDPEAMLETALGPLASAETRRVVAAAETRAQALTFLIMAPEFQRR